MSGLTVTVLNYNYVTYNYIKSLRYTMQTEENDHKISRYCVDRCRLSTPRQCPDRLKDAKHKQKMTNIAMLLHNRDVVSVSRRVLERLGLVGYGCRPSRDVLQKRLVIRDSWSRHATSLLHPRNAFNIFKRGRSQ
jgi:hypothetical protein